MLRPYRLGDERGVCCWDTNDVFYKRPLLNGQETYQIHKNINNNLDKMWGQWNMSQMKEQDKTTEEKISELEIGNLPKEASG